MPAKAARRYAQAFLDLAREEGGLDDAQANLAGLAEVIRACPELAAFLGDYTLPAGKRRAILEETLAPRLHPLTWRLVRFLDDRRRLGLLRDLCEVFHELREREAGVLRGTLESAFALPDAEAAAIRDRLGRKSGGTVALRTSIAPELLGGFRARVGDTVYDCSLATALDAFVRQAGSSGRPA